MATNVRAAADSRVLSVRADGTLLRHGEAAAATGPGAQVQSLILGHRSGPEVLRGCQHPRGRGHPGRQREDQAARRDAVREGDTGQREVGPLGRSGAEGLAPVTWLFRTLCGAASASGRASFARASVAPRLHTNRMRTT